MRGANQRNNRVATMRRAKLMKQIERLLYAESIDKMESGVPTALGIPLEDSTALDILGSRLPTMPATLNL